MTTLTQTSTRMQLQLFESIIDKSELLVWSDHSYGTLLQADASKEFSSQNTLLVVRIRFLPVEIARNREGFNDEDYRKFRPMPNLGTCTLFIYIYQW
uniref:Polysaccharide biosynthesis domain-containing protein n=1 Tax=Glossina austeni TaxID=7395 RepID=A0A1A9UCY9_GLOAU